MTFSGANASAAPIEVRPATGDDLAALAELFGSVDEAVQGRPTRLDAGAVEGWLQTVCLDTNTWLLEDNGVLDGAAFAELHGRRGVYAGAVRPAAQGRGLGTRLVQLAEARLGADGAERVQSWTVAGDHAADDLFRGRRYHEVRRFWDMTIELDGDVVQPALAVEVFRAEDAPAFHAALEEAFQEHWEHRAEAFDVWWSRQQARSWHDPSLWFLVRDGAEIAAAVRNDPNQLGGGFVGALGVRRPWRGRGYGRALLLHSFREFRLRGMTRASLTVDAANETGATRLYESVGMHVDQENVIWEKSLR